MSRPQHLVIVNETPFEVLTTPPAEFPMLDGALDSGEVTYNIVTDTATCTDAPYGVDPVYAITMARDEFLAPDAEDVANWVFNMVGSGLVVNSITYVNPTTVTLQTDGVALAGQFEASLAALATVSGEYDSGTTLYDIVTDLSTIAAPPTLKEGILEIRALAAALAGTVGTKLFTLVTDDAAASKTSESAPTGVILAQIMHEGHNSPNGF
jgi:hypothetical protein